MVGLLAGLVRTMAAHLTQQNLPAKPMLANLFPTLSIQVLAPAWTSLVINVPSITVTIQTMLLLRLLLLEASPQVLIENVFGFRLKILQLVEFAKIVRINTVHVPTVACNRVAVAESVLAEVVFRLV